MPNLRTGRLFRQIIGARGDFSDSFDRIGYGELEIPRAMTTNGGPPAEKASPS